MNMNMNKKIENGKLLSEPGCTFDTIFRDGRHAVDLLDSDSIKALWAAKQAVFMRQLDVRTEEYDAAVMAHRAEWLRLAAIIESKLNAAVTQ
jgi:hypothetical protein